MRIIFIEEGTWYWLQDFFWDPKMHGTNKSHTEKSEMLLTDKYIIYNYNIIVNNVSSQLLCKLYNRKNFNKCLLKTLTEYYKTAFRSAWLAEDNIVKYKKQMYLKEKLYLNKK